MHKTTLLALSLSLLAAPAAAQYGGSINRNAPTVTSAVEFKNSARLQVKFVSIAFGEGQWQAILQKKEDHQKFNTAAAKKPIGMVETNVEVTASNRKIPAGKYDMYFTVHETAGWILNLKNKDDADAKPIMWRMVMQDSKAKSDRFSALVTPGEDAGAASINIAFGAKSVSVPLTLGSPKKKDQ